MKPSIAMLVVVFLAGCATGGSHSGGKTFFIYRNQAGQEVLTTKAPSDSNPRGTPTPTARVTKNSADEEFWQFEARVKNTLYWSPFGIPVAPIAPIGRIPQDFNVIGSQERCEAVRARVTDPTEPCKGPFYFRRETTEASK